jgi:hypothetical protein
MTTYEIRIADHKGRHLFILEDWDAGYDFEYVKVVNGVGCESTTKYNFTGNRVGLAG